MSECASVFQSVVLIDDIITGMAPLKIPQVHDYKKLPRVLSRSTTSPIDCASDLTSTKTSLNSTASSTFGSTLGSLKLSPIQDERETTVIDSPSLTKGLNRIPSVGDLYASPNRTPTAAARAQALAQQKAHEEEAVLKEKLEVEFYKQKLGQRRAEILRRNLASHFQGDGNDGDDSVCESKSDPIPENSSTDNSLEAIDKPTASMNSARSVAAQHFKENKMRINHRIAPLQQVEIKPYDHNPQSDKITEGNQDTDESASVKSNTSRTYGKEDVYIETFEVMLGDIKGPLGQRAGGLRRYFKKLLDNFVSTGCIYRTVNKIGICVHGTADVLDIVKKVLDHAVKKPVSPLHSKSHPYGGGEPIKWKYRSTGRTVRHGIWGKHFTTRLCDKAQRGKYSPRSVDDKPE